MAKQNTTASKEKLQEALELLNEAAGEKQTELKELLNTKYGNLKATVLGAEGRAAEWVGDTTERMLQAKEVGQERLQEASKVVDKRVHEEPWKAAGLVAATAFLIGYIAGRK
ncbi:MAG: hypothetical protein R6V56_00755 [Lentisphaeria bacterium]